MIYFKDSILVYVNFCSVDFRLGLNGLLALIESVFGERPQGEYLFLFRDRTGKKIKAVYWDHNGFMMLYKRLEVGGFQFPKNRAGKIELNRLQLECLLAGMDFVAPKCSKPNEYSVFS